MFSRRVLGTSITCSATTGRHDGEEMVNIRQLFHHLQHRSIESVDQLVPDACVPLHLLLKPRLNQCRWPLLSGGPAIVRRMFEVLGRAHLGAGVNLLSFVGRGSQCPPWSTHRSQHRSDRLLLVSPPRVQSSLFPPLCGTDEGCHGLPSRVQPET